MSRGLENARLQVLVGSLNSEPVKKNFCWIFQDAAMNTDAEAKPWKTLAKIKTSI